MPHETDGIPIPPRDLLAEAERERRRLRAEGASAEKLAEVEDRPLCAACASPAQYRFRDAISDKFTTVHNASRSWTFGGKFLCAGCVWCCKTLALRCSSFFATEAGYHFFGTHAVKGFPSTARSALDALLNPPDPPFVACYPLAGIDHGGEDMLERTLLAAPTDPALVSVVNEVRDVFNAAAVTLLAARPAHVKAEDAKKIVRRALTTLNGLGAGVDGAHAPLSPPWPSALDWAALWRAYGRHRWAPWWRYATWPAIKLQSKHVAIYARVSTNRDRYDLQVDDAGDFVLEVPLWRELRKLAEKLLLDMRQQGVGANDARAALERLQVPFGYRANATSWRETIVPMRPHFEAPWWPLFVSLLDMPALTKTPKGTR